MISPVIQGLETLVASNPNGADPDVKVALSGVAMEVNSRLQSGSNGHVEYMQSAGRAVKKMRGSAHLELRTNALLDVAQYFYLMGQGIEAVDAAKRLSR